MSTAHRGEEATHLQHPLTLICWAHTPGSGGGEEGGCQEVLRQSLMLTLHHSSDVPGHASALLKPFPFFPALRHTLSCFSDRTKTSVLWPRCAQFCECVCPRAEGQFKLDWNRFKNRIYNFIILTKELSNRTQSTFCTKEFFFFKLLKRYS